MSESEKAFFEYIDLALEEHENFQNGFEDARTAFNETFEDHEPFDIADHAHYSAYKEFEQQLASEKAAHAETKRQRDELLSACEFYAREKHWMNGDVIMADAIIDSSDLEKVPNHNGEYYCGGKRARQAIKKVRGEE